MDDQNIEVEISNKDIMNALNSITFMVDDLIRYVNTTTRSLLDTEVQRTNEVINLNSRLDEMQKLIERVKDEEVEKEENQIMNRVEGLSTRVDKVQVTLDDYISKQE